ncbi:MAG: hypothetical protein ISR55_00005, partial [Bacteroidetes bacterium]|nr:hypothetical protein [Bacteroidota bacterium]
MKKFSYALAILFLLVSFMISVNAVHSQGYALDLDGSNDYINLGAST